MPGSFEIQLSMAVFFIIYNNCSQLLILGDPQFYLFSIYKSGYQPLVE